MIIINSTKIINKDWFEVLNSEIEDESIDCIITDPPYYLSDNMIKSEKLLKGKRTKINKKGFMGKSWDGGEVDVITLENIKIKNKYIVFEEKEKTIKRKIKNREIYKVILKLKKYIKKVKNQKIKKDILTVYKTLHKNVSNLEKDYKFIRVNGEILPPENIKEIKNKIKEKTYVETPKYKKEINLYEEFSYLWLKKAYKKLKPGGMLAAFSSSRTYQGLATACERVGFEIKDMLNWIYGTGFPKSYNISKGFDKQTFRVWLKKHPNEKEKLKKLNGEKKKEYRKKLKKRANLKREKIDKKINTYDDAKRNADNHKSPTENSNIGKWGLKDTPHNKFETEGTTNLAKEWKGWGTALKPSHEPIVLVQKPRTRKTVRLTLDKNNYQKFKCQCENKKIEEVEQCIECGKVKLTNEILKKINKDKKVKIKFKGKFSGYCLNTALYGCGGLNIDECRIATNDNLKRKQRNNQNTATKIASNNGCESKPSVNKGRFPANSLLTHSSKCEYIGEKEVGEGKIKFGSKRNSKGIYKLGFQKKKNRVSNTLDNYGKEIIDNYNCHPSCPIHKLNIQEGIKESGKSDGFEGEYNANVYGDYEKNMIDPENIYGDKGGVARYFNNFKWENKDFFFYSAKASPKERSCNGKIENKHPTLKPISVMSWLIRLIAPENTKILDPFAGSGTTAIANLKEGNKRECILVEREKKYVKDIIKARIEIEKEKIRAKK